MRVAFLGSPRWSVPSLEALAGSAHPPVLVMTRRPRRAGRGNRLTRTAVADAAGRLGLPVREAATVRAGSGFEALRDAAPDALVVVAYGEILPQPVLDLARVAPVNLHFSLLPELRGAAPVQHALLEGMTVTGVTTIRMDAGMDTGPILLQAEEAIDPNDDAGTLGERLAGIGAGLLVDTLDRLEAGGIEERPQDETMATYARKLGPEDRVIDWSRPPDEIVRRVRAMAPEPGAVTTYRGRNLKVLRASVRGLHMPASAIPPAGTIFVAAGKDRGSFPEVSTGGLRVVVLEEVAPQGRKRMTGAEFVRGYRPEPGERLG